MWLSQKEQLEKDSVELSALDTECVSQLVLHIKGEANPVPVHCNEDIDAATEKVISEFKLKPEMRGKIETELLRTKVDACQLLEARLKQRLASVQRNAGLVAAYERTAALSEAHVASVAEAYKQVDHLLPQFEAVGDFL